MLTKFHKIHSLHLKITNFDEVRVKEKTRKKLRVIYTLILIKKVKPRNIHETFRNWKKENELSYSKITQRLLITK